MYPGTECRVSIRSRGHTARVRVRGQESKVGPYRGPGYKVRIRVQKSGSRIRGRVRGQESKVKAILWVRLQGQG